MRDPHYAGFFFLVAHCENAVPQLFAEALVRANLPEICLKKVLQHDKTRFGGIFVSVVSD
ncbi:hypothetical protein [Klebsiella pneumoniae]